MRLTYIFHSGFAIETDRCMLIFDYWMDPEGIVPQLLKTEKPVYVFSSHFHEDHFNREIFSWRQTRSDIIYILSKDILKHRRAQKEEADVYGAQNEVYNDDWVKSGLIVLYFS